MSSDLSGIFDFFIFWGKGERGKGFRVANVNWGFEGAASYQQVRRGARWGKKSGIWRFYRRVWKNIFYERRDKERKRGVLGWRRKVWVEEDGERKRRGEGNFWVMYGKGCNMEYSLMECFL